MCTCVYMYEFTQSNVFTCNKYAFMYVYTVHWHSPQYPNMFPPSVEMSSLLAEICSRLEAWMEMRTGTFVDPPQDTGPTGPHPVAQEQM